MPRLNSALLLILKPFEYDYNSSQGSIIFSIHYPLPNFIEWLQTHEICEQYLEYLGHVISTSTKHTNSKIW